MIVEKKFKKMIVERLVWVYGRWEILQKYVSFACANASSIK